MSVQRGVRFFGNVRIYEDTMKKARIRILFVIASLVVFTYISLMISTLQLQFVARPLETATVSSCNVSTWRYTLAVGYREQMTRATQNLFSLVHVALDWGARTVVPFTLDSKLFGLPESNRRKLDVMFNISEMNTNLLCKTYKLPPLSDFEEFMKTADRSIVFVHLAWYSQSFGIAEKNLHGRKAGHRLQPKQVCKKGWENCSENSE